MRIIIVGAGASGIFLASSLKNHEVILLEKQAKIASKMAITGNGRCNISNNYDLNYFISELIGERKFSYHFLKEFNSSHLVEYFKDLLKLEGNLYFSRDNKSTTLIDHVVKQFTNVELLLKHEVLDLIIKDNTVIGVKTEHNTFYGDKVVLCCGGLSFPMTGSTGFAYQMLKQYHTIEPFYSLETGIQIKDFDLSKLSGISFDGAIKYLNKVYYGQILITHKGLSGPLIFKMTQYFKPNQTAFKLSFLGSLKFDDLMSFKNLNKTLEQHFGSILAKRLLKHLIGEEKLGIKFCDLSKKDYTCLITKLLDYPVENFSPLPLSQAYVTGGGLVLKEFNKDFSSKKLNNLYVIGESLNLHGPIGGFNLTLCFSQAKYLGRILDESR